LTETECLPKVLISAHSTPNPKPKFSRPLQLTLFMDHNQSVTFLTFIKQSAHF